MKFSSLTLMISALVGSSLNAQSIKQFIPEAVQKFVPEIIINNDESKHGSHQKERDSKTIHGPANLEYQTFKSLTISGPADLENVTVTHKLEVTGPLNGENVTAAHLKVIGPVSLEKSEIGTGTVTGPAEFKKSVIKGKFTVIGPLKDEKSKFHKEITAHTNHMNLRNSQTQNITIISKELKEEEGGLSFNVGKHIKIMIDNEEVEVGKLKTKPPILHVEGKSTVAGNVTFEGRKGLVILSPGSTLKGKVINGDVRQAK